MHAPRLLSGKTFGLFILALMGQAILCPRASAQTWTIDKELVSETTLKKLKFKYPRILSASDLQNLLKDLGRDRPQIQLEAYWNKDHWVIRGQQAQIIKEIDFKLVTRLFSRELKAFAEKYIGQVDTERLREKIHRSMKQLLTDRGFPKPTIKLSVQPSNGGVRFLYDVTYGYACLIEEVTLGFALPEDTRLDIEAGELCNKEMVSQRIDELSEELRELGYAQLKIDPPKYIYNLKSNTMKILIPGELGRRIRYEIRDKENVFNLSDFFSEDELADIDPSIIGPEAMATEIAQSYRSKGYDDVSVEGPKISQEKDELFIYRYTVKPGPRYVISNISFQGANLFSERELVETMGLTGFWQAEPILNMDKIREGIDAITTKYRQQGFWNVEIREPRIIKNADESTAQLIIFIEEGIQRKLSAVRVNGNKQMSDNMVKELLQTQPGDPLDQANLINLETTLRERYVAMGYLYAQIDIKLEFQKGLRTVFTTVIVDITEGPRVRIGEILVKGLVKTHENVVRRELHFERGDFYDPEKIDFSRRALLNLGIFRSVQIIPGDRHALGERAETLDLLVEVREADAGRVSFGPGWSLDRGNRFSAESSYNNIGGQGRQVFARARLSEESNQKAIGDKTLIGRSISIGYLEPFVLGLPVDSTISGTNSARADETWVLSQSGELAFTHKFRNYLLGSSISLFYGQKINKEISSEEQEDAYLGIIGGNVRLGRIGLRFSWDRRNNITWPTSGFILNGEVSTARYALGGDLNYLHWKVSNSHYFGIIKDLVFAFGFSLNSFTDVTRKGNADILPQSEALFAGGADTVRGFKERSLGPFVEYKDANDKAASEVIGGSHRAVFKLELRYQIIESTLAVTAFTDSGNSFYTQEEIANFDESLAFGQDETTIHDNVAYRFEDLVLQPEYLYTRHYLSYGLAANYLTPLGAINFAYGLPWKRCANDSDCRKERGKREAHWLLDGQFHINIGATF